MRFKLIIAISLTLAFLGYLLYTNNLTGYILAIYIALKSFFAASKTKFVIFIKTLTIAKGLSIAIKRWFIDNILSKWLQSNIFRHFKNAINELILFYRNYSIKNKLKNLLMIIIPTGIIIVIGSYFDILQSFAIYAELKLIVISIFKFLWIFLDKIFIFISSFIKMVAHSWIAPILEIFALSYLIELFERLLGKDNFITKIFNFIGKIYSYIFNIFGSIFNIFGGKVTKRVSAISKVYGKRVENWIQIKKIEQERIDFKELQRFEKEYIDAFVNIKDSSDKEKLYRKINAKTSTNIKIIGYISVDPKNSFKEDIFLLEGAASHNKLGVQKLKPKQIDKSDFWIWNTSKKPCEIKSKSGNFYTQTILPKSLVFIKTKKALPFDDILCNNREFNILD